MQHFTPEILCIYIKFCYSWYLCICRAFNCYCLFLYSSSIPGVSDGICCLLWCKGGCKTLLWYYNTQFWILQSIWNTLKFAIQYWSNVVAFSLSVPRLNSTVSCSVPAYENFYKHEKSTIPIRDGRLSKQNLQ